MLVHELSLMNDALELAIAHAHAEGGSKIHRIVLQVGDRSGVVAEALAFAFDVVSRGTLADGATLDIQTMPALCYCHHCRTNFQPSGWIDECPTCQRISTDLRQGHELQLASLELS